MSFGGTPVTSAITVNATGTQITVTAPVYVVGAVDVVVTVGGTTTNTSVSGQFTYFWTRRSGDRTTLLGSS